ncbi:hypothetical protein [Solimicrobium silvestre]|uniref:Uncharacterized protein n=1 Tax=Solimicrobium silvestre TaxID=2099400 RepID=A0A2S9GYA7_9BURK|nr:hypothetical protein [Solimicrobium silvestre]PRC92688.1 hypothetical protein S2091_2743 [Solimicrobium silvestre]
MQTVKNEHEIHETITIDVFYPDHPPRTESKVFKATKKHWHQLGAVCGVCKTKEKVEIHHKFIEWADSEGTDWDKVRLEHPDFDWASFKDDPDFIDSVYNTEPLCEKHHRGPAPHGKHFTPEPIWNMQKYQRADFVYSPDEVAK